MKRHRSGRRSRSVLFPGVLAIVAMIVFLPGHAAEEKDVAAWPEITEQERGLRSVPQDPEADGVIPRRTRDGKIVTEGRSPANVLDYLWRLKVLNERGKRLAEVHIPSHKYSRVEGIEARTVKPDGTVVPVAADQIFEKLVEKGRGYKITEQVFNYPAVEPGAILEYRYRRHWEGFFGLVYIEPWYFAGPEFTLLSRMTQAVPGDASYRLLCNQCANPEPETAPWKEGKTKGKRLILEMKNVPAYREELMMPPDADVSPRMEMVLRSWINYEWEALGRMDDLFTDWDSLAKYTRYYYQKTYKLDDVAVKQAVASWTKGLSDPNDRIKAVFRHVQEDFRYVPYDDVYGQTSSIAGMLKKKAADNEEKAPLAGSDGHIRSLRVHAVAGLRRRGAVHHGRGVGAHQPAPQGRDQRHPLRDHPEAANRRQGQPRGRRRIRRGGRHREAPGDRARRGVGPHVLRGGVAHGGPARGGPALSPVREPRGYRQASAHQDGHRGA